jgi:lysozyme
MPSLDTNAKTVKSTSNDQFHGMGRMPALFGVFVGWVKRADDVQRNGRLQVWIPEFGTTPEEEQGWITVSYCSPFAGATNVDTISKKNIEAFDGTQTSYGMWMIPPDINNQVLVMFIGGDPARGIWIGCLYNQFMNNMVPAMAADTKNYQYPGKPIPVAEYNKWDTKVTQPDRAMKPYEKTKFQGIGNQGLLTDKIRGITDTSARREAPSAVFGILTPGPAIQDDAAPANIRRKGGSSFIMDDGMCCEYIELATKSGSKIRLDETNGLVYLINRDGTAWVQLDAEGNVDVYSAKNISLRAERDFNIRADRNVNIEAGQNIFMKAAKDTIEDKTTFTYDVNNHPQPREIPYWKYVGEGEGTGGNIVMQALHNWHSTTKNNAFLTVIDNNMDIKIGTSYLLTTQQGGQDFSSKQGIKMTTDAAYDLVATGNIRIGTKATLNITSDGYLALCTSDALSTSSVKDTTIISAATVNVDSELVNIGTNVRMRNLDAANIKATLTDTGTINSRTIAIDKKPIGNGSPIQPTAPADTQPITPQAPLSAAPARPAEVKPMNEKINILATWKDPDSKFVRNAEPLFTTTSRFPTYEPCPEHENFDGTQVSTTKPELTETDKTYAGSGGKGNTQSTPPDASTTPGSNNNEVQGDPAADSSPAKAFNTAAFDCQIKIHEGVRNKSYLDTEGLLTGGVGHLLRANEISMYPLGTPIPEDQISKWLEQDTSTSIKIAQTLCGDNWDKLSDTRKRAVADLAYNLGQPRLSKFTKFLSAMKENDFDKAAIELRNSKWYSQVGRRGPDITTMIAQNVDPNGCDKKFPG